KPHVAAEIRIEPRAVQQPDIKGRDTHQHGRLRQMVKDRIAIKFWQENYPRAVEQSAMEGDEQAMDMEDRQRMEEDVARPPLPEFMENKGVGREIAMGQHGPLRPPGGAGSVENGRHVIACNRRALEVRRVARGRRSKG